MTQKTVQTAMHRDLRKLGAVMYDFWLPETHALPSIIHQDERIQGIVYGRYKHYGGEETEGRGALVATSKRILLVDKKPMFLRCDELTYEVVSGVTYTKAGPAGTVTLHTRAGDISVRTFNHRCAKTFVAAIETNRFQGLGL